MHQVSSSDRVEDVAHLKLRQGNKMSHCDASAPWHFHIFEFLYFSLRKKEMYCFAVNSFWIKFRYIFLKIKFEFDIISELF